MRLNFHSLKANITSNLGCSAGGNIVDGECPDHDQAYRPQTSHKPEKIYIFNPKLLIPEKVNLHAGRKNHKIEPLAHGVQEKFHVRSEMNKKPDWLLVNHHLNSCSSKQFLDERKQPLAQSRAECQALRWAVKDRRDANESEFRPNQVPLFSV